MPIFLNYLRRKFLLLIIVHVLAILAMQLTPMIQQYLDLKKKYSDCLLFFRLGDFYELFGEDAEEASKLLNLTLTSRYKGEGRIPMCGVPYHSVDGYLARLTKLGKKVAICEQLSDPKLPGLVKRDVIRVVTPGTTFDSRILDYKSNNFIVAIAIKNEQIGIAIGDVTTGDLRVSELKGFEQLELELTKIAPTEIVIEQKIKTNSDLTKILSHFANLTVSSFDYFYNPLKELTDHFHVNSLDCFKITDLTLGISAAGLLLRYLKDTQKSDLAHMQKLTRYTPQDYLKLDESSLRNLELLSTFREGKKDGSLLAVLDETETAMGGRLFHFFLLHPLLDKNEIEVRLEAVSELYNNQQRLQEIKDVLKKVADIERICGKLGLSTVTPRDLLGLKSSLQLFPLIKEQLINFSALLLQKIDKDLECFPGLVDLLERSLLPEPSIHIKEGNIIRDGFNQELDELRAIARNGKQYLLDLQQKEIERTKISSLKIRFNKIFGYYIEVTKSNLKNVPADYIRKQTLVNGERFITEELKDFEEKILKSEEKSKELEYGLFIEVRDSVVKEIADIKKSAQAIALLDVFSSFAYKALHAHYTRPTVSNGERIEIRGGRHAVVEASLKDSAFVPNETLIDNSKNQFVLITGPNMSGKSTYIRQVALICLMAQIGSYVPADFAEIGLIDGIFTRVGSSDNLTQGQSTFMTEMQETAYILHNATSKSLIILDEVGRGTSTYDGVSIAWAITEYLHDRVGAKTLFATHYHELTPLVSNLAKGQNLCVAVEETKDGVIFLHKIKEGVTDKSYGIEVAKLAGIPKEVTDRANTILKNLEEGVIDKYVKKEVRKQRWLVPKEQLELFIISKKY